MFEVDGFLLPGGELKHIALGDLHAVSPEYVSRTVLRRTSYQVVNSQMEAPATVFTNHRLCELVRACASLWRVHGRSVVGLSRA